MQWSSDVRKIRSELRLEIGKLMLDASQKTLTNPALLYKKRKEIARLLSTGGRIMPIKAVVTTVKDNSKPAKLTKKAKKEGDNK